MEYLPAIISAIGTIIAAWFAYNQYAKNKFTDLKIEKFKRMKKLKAFAEPIILLSFTGNFGAFFTNLMRTGCISCNHTRSEMKVCYLFITRSKERALSL